MFNNNNGGADGNFDAIFAIPCEMSKNHKGRLKNTADIFSAALASLDNFCDALIKYEYTELLIKNSAYNKSNLLNLSKIFCEQIKEHGDYELIFYDEHNNIKTERMPFIFGQVILYEDEKPISSSQNTVITFFVY